MCESWRLIIPSDVATRASVVCIMDRRIRQPPHSAGQPFKGLRSKLDPAQIPSPIAVAEATQESWADQPYMSCGPILPPPPSSSDFTALDQGNSTPQFIRVTTYNFPYSSALASSCSIPLAACIQPFVELSPDEESVPVIDFGENGPPRCSQPWCRAYINPWCFFTQSGSKWKCNLCEQETEVSSEYFCSLDANLRRLDHLERVELNRGTIDYVVPEQYWAVQPDSRLVPSYHSPIPFIPKSRRPPMSLRHVFAIDVSYDAVSSGFLQSTCSALLDFLLDPQTEPLVTEIALITFDSTIHFYRFSANSESVSMHVLADLDDPFIPLYHDGLFVKLHELRHAVAGFLERLPRRFTDSVVRGSAIGSALCCSLASLSGRGGRVTAFIASPLKHGQGVVPPREQSESTLYGTDKEKTLFMPSTDFWKDLGEECAEEGVSVNLFLAPSQSIDVGSLRTIATLTGGEMFHFPRYRPSMDEYIFSSQLRRSISRDCAYNCTMRVRCSKGIRVSEYIGGLQSSASLDVILASCDPEKAIFAVLNHSGIQLDERSNVYLQAAILYTTVFGQRRVRVCNLALPISTMAGNVFKCADQEAVVSLWMKQAVASMPTTSLRNIRDRIIDKTVSVLIAYRKNCAAATAPSQLILPEQFKLLPIYSLCIMKSRAFKGRTVISDVRNYHAHKITVFGISAMIQYLYPKLLALHDLTNDICIPDPAGTQMRLPSLMRCSYIWMENNGIYLIDNGEEMLLWIGASVSPQLLLDLYGVETIHDLDVNVLAFPTQTATLFATQVNNLLSHRESRRKRRVKLIFARQDLDAAEIDFSDLLVEDQNNDAMSYVDHLCFIHKQINTALTSGVLSSYSQTPW